MNTYTVKIVTDEALEHLSTMYQDPDTGEDVDALRLYAISREGLASHLADFYGSKYWLREDEQSKVEESLLAEIDRREEIKAQELSIKAYQLQAIDSLLSNLSTRRRLIHEGTSWTKTTADLREALNEYLEEFYYLLDDEEAASDE